MTKKLFLQSRILSFQARSYQKALTEETPPAQVKECQFAVTVARPPSDGGDKPPIKHGGGSHPGRRAGPQRQPPNPPEGVLPPPPSGYG